jgi:hypothetical protein
MSIVSGSSADRGLRASRLLSLGVASMDALLAPSDGGAERGGPATVSREYDTSGGIGEGLVFAARGGPVRGTSAGAARFVGGLESVTAGYPLFQDT